jgi:hypothetical protein
MDLSDFIRLKSAEFARDAREPRAPMDAAEEWFVDLLRKHLHDALRPIIEELAAQLDAREQLARNYLAENHGVRIEVARLAENVIAMRGLTPTETTIN